MVKSHSYSSSEEDSEHTHKKKHSKKRHKESKRKRQHDSSPGEQDERKLKIKAEPVSDDDFGVESRSRVKHERHRATKREHADSDDERYSRQQMKEEESTGTSRHRDGHRGGRRERDRGQHYDRHSHHGHVRVKQEPPDSDEEMRNQREERRGHDQRRRENRQRREEMPESQRFGRGATQAEVGRDTQEGATGQDNNDAPNFELSGKLTEDTNTYKGVVIKYNEPPEARKPKKRWRLYPFKNDEPLKPFHMHRQSAFLFGRDRIVADIPVDHPSCSKQHAVFQYRMVPYEKPDGRKAYRIAPYIIDLDSANGTFVNNKQIEGRRYFELFEKDVIKFGFSSREYVLLHDKSNTDEVASDESD
ncbi:SNIP1-like protein [Mya arenaria]|uniref:SNIP1-like protein n=1 Tax=Mya arenaria TaxID=6604 RepID=A0ABY7EKR4_MYAAR|nr:uncharacterized protein LOC128239381 [Mya arenaria]WAR08989.1 SNIP1-like protein [Mya arenaria]